MDLKLDSALASDEDEYVDVAAMISPAAEAERKKKNDFDIKHKKQSSARDNTRSSCLEQPHQTAIYNLNDFMRSFSHIESSSSFHHTSNMRQPSQVYGDDRTGSKRPQSHSNIKKTTVYAFRPAAAPPQAVSTHYIDAPYSRLSISNVVIPQAVNQRPQAQVRQSKNLNEIKSYLPESEKPMYKFILGSKHGKNISNDALKTVRKRKKGRNELKLIIRSWGNLYIIW